MQRNVVKLGSLALGGPEIHQLLKFFVIGVGIGVPVVFGYWRYTTSSEANILRDAIGWGILSLPLSLGLFLSVTEIGRRLRYLSLSFVFLGALVHLIFSVYPIFFLPVVALAYLIAVYFIFKDVD